VKDPLEDIKKLEEDRSRVISDESGLSIAKAIKIRSSGFKAK